MQKVKMKEINATDKDFKKKVIEKSKKIPIVIDFWAEWCVPCLTLSPILEEFAEQYKGKFILVKVNIEKAPKFSNDVMSIPNVKMFKNGKIVDEFVGVRSESFIKKWLERNLNRKV